MVDSVIIEFANGILYSLMNWNVNYEVMVFKLFDRTIIILN